MKYPYCPFKQNGPDIVQSGYTLSGVAKHFGMPPNEITSSQMLAQTGLLTAGQQLILPIPPESALHNEVLMPGSAMINSPCGTEFEIEQNWAPFV
jgi:LysM repeat protein